MLNKTGHLSDARGRIQAVAKDRWSLWERRALAPKVNQAVFGQGGETPTGSLNLNGTPRAKGREDQMQRITAKQVAEELLGESYWTFIRKMNRGEYVDIPHFRTGCGERPHYFFYREKVEEWISKSMSKTPGKNTRKAG